MENATKALVMVANMLLAVIILSLVLYFYNRLRTLPLEEDLNTAIEQAQEFNKQFEVYDKRIMYGVDVVSALNKAISNNEKYIQGKWMSGALSSTEFAIEIVVVIGNELKEDVVVRYYNGNNEVPYTTNDGYKKADGTFYKFKDLLGMSTSPKFRVPTEGYMNLYSHGTRTLKWDNSLFDMKTHEIPLNRNLSDDSKKGDRYVFNLLPDSDGDGKVSKPDIANDEVYLKYLADGLATFTASGGQTVYNREKITVDGKKVDNIQYGGWSSLTWTPAITDLKSRKFKCAGVDSNGKIDGTPGIVYNEETGAICKITFIEYGLD